MRWTYSLVPCEQNNTSTYFTCYEIYAVIDRLSVSEPSLHAWCSVQIHPTNANILEQVKMIENQNLPWNVFLPKELTSAALNTTNPKKNMKKWQATVIAYSSNWLDLWKLTLVSPHYRYVSPNKLCFGNFQSDVNSAVFRREGERVKACKKKGGWSSVKQLNLQQDCNKKPIF